MAGVLRIVIFLFCVKKVECTQHERRVYDVKQVYAVEGGRCLLFFYIVYNRGTEAK